MDKLGIIKAEINLRITDLTIAEEEGYITERGKGALEYLLDLQEFVRSLTEEDESMPAKAREILYLSKNSVYGHNIPNKNLQDKLDEIYNEYDKTNQ